MAKGATEAIRAANPGHRVIADGNRVGNLVTPELKELNIAQGCRGYFPSGFYEDRHGHRLDGKLLALLKKH